MVTASSDKSGDVLLEVSDLRMYFPVTSGIIFQKKIVLVYVMEMR